MTDYRNKVFYCDVREALAAMPDNCVQCVVTSPPYWGLRKYAGNQEVVWSDGSRSALGLEKTIEAYVAHIVEIWRELKRVLRKDGVCFLNIGDSFASGHGERHQGCDPSRHDYWKNLPKVDYGALKPKDMCLIPARLALALQADGWYVRSDIIWAKPNPMPESCNDRPSKSYDHILMLTKSAHYFWDAEAVREPHNRDWTGCGGNIAGSGQHKYGNGYRDPTDSHRKAVIPDPSGRNIRDVWTMPTAPFSDWDYDFVNADCVGDDGKPYKVSKDCPIHSQLLGSDILKRDAYGELPILSRNHIPDIPSYPAQEQQDVSVSNPRPDGEDLQISNIALHKPENKPDHKTVGENKDKPQKNRGTEGTQQIPASNSDSASLLCAPIAKHRNRQSHKKDRALETNSSYISSEEKTCHTDGKQGELEKTDSVGHICESNISADCAQDVSGLSGQKSCHSVDKSSSVSYGNYIKAKCTCQVSSLSHFATFPPELPRRCILAGSSHKACPKCNAPWKRILAAASGGAIGKAWLDHTFDEVKGNFKTVSSEGYRAGQTLGWQPSCKCEGNNGSGKCLILDPFAGSGTTLAVAAQLGRDWCGIEIAEEYRSMIEKRLAEPLLGLSPAEVDAGQGSLLDGQELL